MYCTNKYIFRLLEVEKKKEALVGKLEMVELRKSANQTEELKLLEGRQEEMKTLKKAQTLRCGNRHKMIQKFQIICDFDSQLMTDEKVKMLRELCQLALRQPESTLANLQEFFEVYEHEYNYSTVHYSTLLF